MTIGAMVGPEAFTEVQLPRARQADAGARADPRDRRRLRARVRPRLRRPDPHATAPRTRRRSSSRSARCSARSRTSSTSCATTGVEIGAVGITLVPPVPARRAARGAGRRQARASCSRRRSRSASAGSSRANVRMALAGIQLHGYTVIAGLGGRAITKASLRRLFSDAVADAPRAADLPRSRLGRRRTRAGADARLAPLRPACGEHPARRRTGRGGPGMRSARCMTAPAIKFYQTGSFAVGNRLLDPDQRSVQADERRAPTRSPAGTAPARAAARRSARATRSTRRCAPPTAS